MLDHGDVGGSPCIYKSTDLDSIAHGSRKPIQAFTSPFFDKTDSEIRAWLQEQEQEHSDFAQATFVILEKNAIKNKTCRIGYTEGDDRMILTDFRANMFVRCL